MASCIGDSDTYADDRMTVILQSDEHALLLLFGLGVRLRLSDISLNNLCENEKISYTAEELQGVWLARFPHIDASQEASGD